MESIYWVISRDCNQRCGHCYNNSEPGAPGLSLDEIERCVEHFPVPDDVPVHRVILSGGEVLVWPELLFRALECLNQHFGDATEFWIQTNGDLLDATVLKRLLAHNVVRVDVSSMDAFHNKSTVARRRELVMLFEKHGLHRELFIGTRRPSYAFWGATEDKWIGPLWPRGRARQNGLSAASVDNKFCSMWSGAKGFLNYRQPGSEVNIQLADVYPCCPMTCRPLGSLLAEPLTELLDRCAEHPVYRALNAGRPDIMGESLGVSEAEARERIEVLGNECLWCDEFFTTYGSELLSNGHPTERGRADLDLPVIQPHPCRPNVAAVV